MPDDRRDPQRQTSQASGRRMTDKIACPECGSLQSKVINCRPGVSSASFWRERRCEGCSSRYETEEAVSTKNLHL